MIEVLDVDSEVDHVGMNFLAIYLHSRDYLQLPPNVGCHIVI